MNTGKSNRPVVITFLYLLLVFFLALARISTAESEPPAADSATPYKDGSAPVQNDAVWDLVVLGRIDACWVCQHGPPPHVSYTRVLAGKAVGGEDGYITIIELPNRLLPKGGIPIYKSSREEICYLKIVVLPNNKNAVAYKVIDVEEATAENLAKFSSVRQQ